MNLKTLAAAVAVGLLTAGSAAYAQDKGTIGIAMPTKTSARWIADGDNMVKTLRPRATRLIFNTPTTTFRPSSPRSRT